MSCRLIRGHFAIDRPVKLRGGQQPESRHRFQSGCQVGKGDESQRTRFTRWREVDAGNGERQKWGVADAGHCDFSVWVGDDRLVEVRRRLVAGPELGQLAAGSSRSLVAGAAKRLQVGHDGQPYVPAYQAGTPTASAGVHRASRLWKAHSIFDAR
jgi:hypothetical protein